jgi:hypothetical protein
MPVADKVALLFIAAQFAWPLIRLRRIGADHAARGVDGARDAPSGRHGGQEHAVCGALNPDRRPHQPRRRKHYIALQRRHG